MPILAVFTGKMTVQEYEALKAELDFERKHPPGAMVHAASFDEKTGDVRVADVWASEGEMMNFVTGHLMPWFQKHNIGKPQVDVLPCHNVVVYPTIDKHLLQAR